MTITCGNCGTELEDDGSVAAEDNEEWCNNCDDMRPFEDGVCQRCGES